MNIRAHAKINWSLGVTGRRSDGYHLLDMVMQTIGLCDDIALERADALTLTVNGEPCADEGNLVLRAARALNRRAGTNHGAAMALTKRIPAQAGLGGGSADCAATLRALNALWALGMSDGELAQVGLSLGADVPFCLQGGLARVTGVGERLESVAPKATIPLVLVKPGAGLSTAAVFGEWDRGGDDAVWLDNPALAAAVARGDLRGAAPLCGNDLTAPALRLLPELRAILDAMGERADAAFMTGSGSTVVGAFADAGRAREAARAFPGAILTCTEPGAGGMD